MIYSQKIKLDMGNEIQMRIGKTEKLRLTSHNLNDHIKQYVLLTEKTLNCEKLILKDLDFLNSGYSHYEPLCHNLKIALEHKNEITTRNLSNIKTHLKKSKEIEKQFEALRPFIKKYFQSLKKLKHYEVKLPKLRNVMSGKEKKNGRLTDKETNKLIRNERKLKAEQDTTKISSDKIVIETNKLNIKRFSFQNPIIREFIGHNLASCYLMKEKYHVLDNFETILNKPETEDFNERFFLNVKEGSKIHFKKNPKDKMMKQNIQNNYYYINDGQDVNENKTLPQNQKSFTPSQSFGNEKNKNYNNDKKGNNTIQSKNNNNQQFNNQSQNKQQFNNQSQHKQQFNNNYHRQQKQNQNSLFNNNNNNQQQNSKQIGYDNNNVNNKNNKIFNNGDNYGNNRQGMNNNGGNMALPPHENYNDGNNMNNNGGNLALPRNDNNNKGVIALPPS